MANLFLAFEPLAGVRRVEVTDRKTSRDFAHFARRVLDEWYPAAERVVFVLDNLSTHAPAAFYEAFAPAEARRLAERFEIHYTPKHGSWLNMAEIELSVLHRQCLDRRIESAREMARQVDAWQEDRNEREVGVQWRFTTADARIKLHKLYPTI
jgi:transposase